MEVFLTAWFVTFLCNPVLFAAIFKNFPIEFFPSGAFIYHTVSLGFRYFVVYCQVERRFSIMHLCRTMASELFVKENRAACVVAGLCYGTEWPAWSFAIAAF